MDVKKNNIFLQFESGKLKKDCVGKFIFPLHPLEPVLGRVRGKELSGKFSSLELLLCLLYNGKPSEISLLSSQSPNQCFYLKY